MKVIVTGGMGFIGSNFINMLVSGEDSAEVVNVDKMTYASDPANLQKPEAIENYKLDISRLTGREHFFEDADTIVNFAAESHVDRSIKNSKDFIQSNVVGVHRLLEITRKLDLRYHQISTDEVYGSLPLNSGTKFTENSAYSPRNPYSATKASADLLVKAYHNTYGIRATISNCSNNYGPNQHPEKLIPKTILYALNGMKIPIYGSGRQVRDWIHVADHCTAIRMIIERGKPGETYLVGADGERSNIEVVREILEILHKPESLIEFVQDRPGHDQRYAIDSTKIRRELGWRPEVDFDQGLRETIQHYIASRKRYEEKVL